MSLPLLTKIILFAAKCHSNGCQQTSKTGAVRHLKSKQLIFCEFGNPLDVVKYKECEVPSFKKQEVLVRMLAAPVNPSDINTIQGKYPVKIKLPMIPGNEGVGIVEKTESSSKDMSQGSKVIVTKPAQGTWRDYGVFNKDSLKTVPNELGIAEASTITVNPCTAYRMLSDFRPVREKGLTVIQNGANSACGQYVIQLCKAWGIKNIGVIRERPEVEPLKDYLKCLGATYVLTESELTKTEIFKKKEIEKPSLALNCVGGKISSEMLRHLQHSGCMVTYGGMSREPVIIPTSAFIFKNLQFFGFWLTKWNEIADSASKDRMLDEIIELMCCGKLRACVHKMVKLKQYQEALRNTLTKTGFAGTKYILDFT